jgi:hypothetical protein
MYHFLIAPVRSARTPNTALSHSLEEENYIGPYNVGEDPIVLPRWVITESSASIGDIRISLPSERNMRSFRREVDRQNDLLTAAEMRLAWYHAVFDRLRICSRNCIRALRIIATDVNCRTRIIRERLSQRIQQLTVNTLDQQNELESLGVIFDVVTAIQQRDTYDV